MESQRELRRTIDVFSGIHPYGLASSSCIRTVALFNRRDNRDGRKEIGMVSEKREHWVAYDHQRVYANPLILAAEIVRDGLAVVRVGKMSEVEMLDRVVEPFAVQRRPHALVDEADQRQNVGVVMQNQHLLARPRFLRYNRRRRHEAEA